MGKDHSQNKGGISREWRTERTFSDRRWLRQSDQPRTEESL